MYRKTIAVCAVFAALGIGSTRAADQAPLRVQGSKGILVVDARGISLTPASSACPSIRATGEPMWAVLMQKDGAPPIQGTPIPLTNLGQAVQHETLPSGIRLTYPSLTDGKRTWHVSVTLDIRRKGDAFEITGRVANDEPGWVMCGFVGPVFDGIQADLAAYPLLLPEGFGRRVNRVPTGKGKHAPWHAAGKRFETGVNYPSAHGTMQWCALAGSQGGLYLG